MSLNLLLVTTSTGVNHQEQWVDNLIPFVVLQLTVKRVSDVIGSVGPDVNDLLVALVVSDYTITILLCHFLNFCVGFF